MEFVDLRRRWMVGGILGAGATAGLIVALPAFAQTGSDKMADTGKPPMPASERLMRDNALTSRVLLLYAAAARRLDQGEDLEAGIFTQSAEVMRDFVHGYHEKAEEDDVFPVFKKAGRMVELVATLQSQHVAGRQLTDKVLAAAPGIANADQRKILTDSMHATVTLYEPCLARENTDLLPTLRSLMTPTEFDALAQTLEKAEGGTLGAEGFDKAAKKVEAIEKKLGTHDLSQFTPKT
jgi:hemerythrin-like domain-containing protein